MTNPAPAELTRDELDSLIQHLGYASEIDEIPAKESLRQLFASRDDRERKYVELCHVYGNLLIAHHDLKNERDEYKRKYEEALGHAAGMSNDVTRLGEQLAASQARVKELEEATRSILEIGSNAI